MMFSVNKGEGQDVARGYLLEVEQGDFQLPELGPIGSNGLVNVRDVCHPVASYDDISPATPDYDPQHIIWNKFGGQLFGRTQSHSPFNVVAWHGNYVPFKYDLNQFCAVGSVTYDHLDPSIYTVLTVPSHGEPGTALCNFVIFPSNRIMATDSNTLRPPWFYRNVMTEFMGLLDGVYDAKQGDGFQPGGASLHSCMSYYLFFWFSGIYFQ
jgi:homogentisate 1,2-dioxygenase